MLLFFDNFKQPGLGKAGGLMGLKSFFQQLKSSVHALIEGQ
ncbi:thiol-disulfide oxidoreductase [Bacillus sp. NRRL B-14911]|uniref:Uncharacterized protein n=1 Tax=Bacillus infantis NRRL B-14911 TaxID=1367477 RepID=U5LFT1_9BACI|nr:hypothetical protein N288_24295 [Bacillus infantis NRRL B-14911]EAR67604.1 thiol-disulfide oxidoreductase [Bacillus sp. NRRL B-14911]